MAVRLARVWAQVFLHVGLLGAPLYPQTSAAQHEHSNEIPVQLIVVHTQEEARQVIEQLRSGARFAGLARQKSIDPTAEAGGFMGKIDPNTLRTELREALRGVGEGQFTEPVRLPSGYAILKVMAKGDTDMPGQADAARNFAMSATGTVKYTAGFGGFSEAEAAVLNFPKAPGWNTEPSTICDLRKRSLSGLIEKASKVLAPENAPAMNGNSAIDVMQAHYALGELHAYQGEMGLALEQYTVAHQMAVSEVPQSIPLMEETLGVAYLHKSEMENDAYRAPGDRCLFPPVQPGSAYAQTADSEAALEYFLKYLEKKPDDLEVRWLLNLTYLTLGKYPAGVPEKYRMPEAMFESAEDVGRFTDVAEKAGLRLFSMAGGAIVEDFENNGLLDVVTSSFGSCSTMHYFHNNGDGTFTDQSTKSGLAGQVGGLNIVQTDYNNDGCVDILVLRGGWEWAQRKSLLRNNCDGTFTDVTVAAGLGEPTATQAAVWVDINNDGWLDLFVGNENGPAQLFLNKGDGTFQDIALEAGVAGDGSAFSKGVAAADYDDDGYADLYVSNLNGNNFLYHNNHNNTFTEVAKRAGVPGSGRGFATWFFDYDNDGHPDLFATSYYTSVDESVRTYMALPHNGATMKLYRNMGDGSFRDVTKETGLDKVLMPMGANFGDVDNDGYLDMYLGTGNPSYASLIPNVLLRNHDGKYFVDITASSGTGELHKGHAVAFADLGNNGNEDIVAEVGGATMGDSHALRVFANPGHGNDWITLKLVGVKSNRAAIGARIKVTVENEGRGTRLIYRTVGSGGSFGSSPLQQHIGLGPSAKIVSVEVNWPASQTRQVFQAMEKNQFVEIREFAETYTKLDRKAFRLAGTPASGPVTTTAASGTSSQTRKR